MAKVVLLQVSLRWELEEAQRDIEQVVRALGPRWHRKAQHMRYSVTFVIVTSKTETDLMNRLRTKMERVRAVERFWVFLAPHFAMCTDGPVDPFSSAILDAWDVVRDRNQPQDMRRAQRPGDGTFRPVQNRDRGTVR